MTDAQFNQQVARITEVADRYARMMGCVFVVDIRKIADWRKAKVRHD